MSFRKDMHRLLQSQCSEQEVLIRFEQESNFFSIVEAVGGNSLFATPKMRTWITERLQQLDPTQISTDEWDIIAVAPSSLIPMTLRSTYQYVTACIRNNCLCQLIVFKQQIPLAAHLKQFRTTRTFISVEAGAILQDI